jgi:hypothetical protein
MLPTSPPEMMNESRTPAAIAMMKIIAERNTGVIFSAAISEVLQGAWPIEE